MRSGINSFCQTQQTNPQWRHTSLKEKKPALDVRLVWKKTQGSILSSGITKLQNFLGFFFSIFLGGSEIVVIYKTLLKKCQISVNCYVITVEPVKTYLAPIRKLFWIELEDYANQTPLLAEFGTSFVIHLGNTAKNGPCY